MPHHSHLGGDGLPAVQAGTGGASEAAPRKKRGPALWRGAAKRTVRPTEGVTIAGLAPLARGSRPTVAGSTRVLQRKRRQPDSGGEEEEVEVTGAREQPKKSRQAPPGAVSDVKKENERYAKLEQVMSLVRDRVTTKEKKIEILQRESAAKQSEIKRLEGEVARLEAEGSRAAAAAVESYKQSAEHKKPSKEAPPTTSTAPTAAPGPGVRSGSGESGEPPEGDSQRTPTQSEVSRAGFLEPTPGWMAQ
ncbi:uncharacterized protein LOC112178422 [Rosa chinensis]|uniref:uncharacterized protein LOC112178422 n=1 Tax=Rosa chinensis TaxID=74649 RepID=UPI000D0934C3|nr:uncharacterized protein LOC112178422 [Rosa chinensis]